MNEESGNGMGTELEKFLNDIRTVVQDGEELLKAGVTGLKGRAAAGVRSTDLRVREHPYQSLLVVFGLGVLVGALAAGVLTGEGGAEED